jgi:hypothetical protein
MIRDLRRARFERELVEAIAEVGGEVARLGDFLDRWRHPQGLEDRQLRRLRSLRRDFYLVTGERPWLRPLQLELSL